MEESQIYNCFPEILPEEAKRLVLEKYHGEKHLKYIDHHTFVVDLYWYLRAVQDYKDGVTRKYAIQLCFELVLSDYKAALSGGWITRQNFDDGLYALEEELP